MVKKIKVVEIENVETVETPETVETSSSQMKLLSPSDETPEPIADEPQIQEATSEEPIIEEVEPPHGKAREEVKTTKTG